MSPQAWAVLEALWAWLRSLAQADAFAPVIAATVAVWVLRGQRDYAPRNLGKVLIFGIVGYIVAAWLHYLAQRG